MKSRFTADRARQMVAKAFAPYKSKEVYERIEKLAKLGQRYATFALDRWSDELTAMLSGDGYGVKVLSSYGDVRIIWGKGDRRLREGGNDCE